MTVSVDELVERAGDEADLCRNEGAADIASLLDALASRLKAMQEALERQRVFLRDCIKEPSLVCEYTFKREADMIDTLLTSEGTAP